MTTPLPSVPDLRLVVGYDGSPPASRALDTAAGLLLGRAGHLTLVYVAHVPSAAAMSAQDVGDLEDSFDQADLDLQASAREQLHDFAPGWDFVRRDGPVTDELMAAAAEIAAAHAGDTVGIVVGSSSARAHRLLGSVATSLARHSHVPLLIVP
jgi:nucleotide-binding universal stress UspA family protein